MDFASIATLTSIFTVSNEPVFHIVIMVAQITLLLLWVVWYVCCFISARKHREAWVSTVQHHNTGDLHSPCCAAAHNSRSEQAARWSYAGWKKKWGKKRKEQPGLYKVLKGWVSLHPPLAWGESVLEQKLQRAAASLHNQHYRSVIHVWGHFCVYVGVG